MEPETSNASQADINEGILTEEVSSNGRHQVSLDMLQRTMADAMANIIARMTNKTYRDECLAMLKVTNAKDQEVKTNLLSLLHDIEDEIIHKKEKPKRKTPKRATRSKRTKK